MSSRLEVDHKIKKIWNQIDTLEIYYCKIIEFLTL